MKPKFKDIDAWEQAELLMQPAFIRVIDNLRQQLEVSDWQGDYQEVQEPFPGYELSLSRKEHSVKVNVWDLCFEVCFTNYNTSLNQEDTTSQEVEIDLNLFNDNGEVDWQKLENKTQRLVKQIFINLPE